MSVFELSDLTYHPEKLNGLIGVGNAYVQYDDPFINANIERVTPNPSAQASLVENFLPAGNVGNKKIIFTHTNQDPVVFVENGQPYIDVIPAANLAWAVVAESSPSHCGYSDAEIAAGWVALLTWVEGGVKPTVVTIQNTCLNLIGQFSGPCRYDPSYVIPNLDTRIHPRGAAPPPPDYDNFIFLPLVAR
jgi:hypothetical protein